jgi:hypothetical protein
MGTGTAPSPGGGCSITGEVTVSALSSQYLLMLRDYKCLVRCQVSRVCLVCLSQLPWTRERKHTRGVTRGSGSPRQLKPLGKACTG